MRPKSKFRYVSHGRNEAACVLTEIGRLLVQYLDETNGWVGVLSEKSYPRVAMMQSTQDGHSPLDCSMQWRILVQ